MKNCRMFLGLIVTTVGLLAAPVHAKRDLPAPVHPDTLPTLLRAWSLPASLSATVTNVYAPRVTLAGGILYLYDHHGRRLAAVKSANGKVLWHKPVPSRTDRAFAFTPLVDKGRVFVASDGYLYSFDAKTGAAKWRLGTKGVAVNGLARSKHRIYLPWIRVQQGQAMPTVQVWAVDARRAQIEWNKSFPGRMAFLEGDADGVYYVGSTGVVLGLTPDRGDYKWKARVKGAVRTPPILKSGRLYITTERRRAEWSGTGVYVVDVKTGKLLWETKLASTNVIKFLHGNQLTTVESDGRLTLFSADGKKVAGYPLDMRFVEEPLTLSGAAVGGRAFVFSSHPDGNGFVRLVDLDKKKLVVSANALDAGAHTMLATAKKLYIDSVDGNLYAYSLQSQRPERMSVPPAEFAQEMLRRVAGTKKPVSGLASKLAGLGPKALSAIEPALQSPNPYVAAVAAEAVGLIGNRRSLQSLLAAANDYRSRRIPAGSGVDPLLPVLNAIAELGDGRAVGVLKRVMLDENQSHHRRRAAYVALGAIGNPVSLAPIWSFRAAKQIRATTWHPMPYTPSYAHGVEEDVTTTADSWSEDVRMATTRTVQAGDNRVFTAALSPYLGGYNDIWFGPSDLSGLIGEPLFTGLTKPEVAPGKRIRIRKLQLMKDDTIQIQIELQQHKRWVSAKPVTLSLKALRADLDGDGLPDVVERRLRLARTNADTDGDGLKDAEDLNPLASGKLKLTDEQRLYQEAFFAYFAFLKRRGLVVVDPGEGPSFEVYGRVDPVLSLRRPTIEDFRREVGLHAVDYVSFGGPYPEGGGSGDALRSVLWNKKKTEATIGMDIFRSAENAVGYNVSLAKAGNNWVVTRLQRVWSTNE